MAWQPIYPATDIRKIAPNLLSFFDNNQEDALAYANPDRALQSLAIYPTAESRIKLDFPHVGLTDYDISTAETDAGLVVVYDLSLEFELSATHTEAGRTEVLSQLLLDALDTLYAYESMSLNIPDSVLYANVEGVTGGISKYVTRSKPLFVSISDTESLINIQMKYNLKFIASPIVE